ncbi:putative transcription factor interactor and regulator CCHC(Zn) family [Helianthus annuus]|nr:putative transcription factor interactor and regulator CCHC(Zn) family [Helianthus annuus]
MSFISFCVIRWKIHLYQLCLKVLLVRIRCLEIQVVFCKPGVSRGCPGESTKSIIERYSHLVRLMSKKGIQKNPNEWVKRLANSIPQQEWGTYLLDLKRNGEYSRLSICQFIQKLEEQMENNDVNKKNQEEKSVSSDESSEESIVVDQTSTDSGSSDESSERAFVFDQTSSNSGSSDDSSDKLVEFDQSPTDNSSVNEKIIEAEKVTEAEKVVEVEKIIEIEKIVEVTKPCLMCLESCKQCIEKDERFSELEKLKEQLLFDVKNLKKSYDVLNRHVNGLEKTNSEREKALKMLNVTMMTKQKEINMYIEECAKLKKELENEAAENERIRRLLQSYKGCDYVMDRIYPTVEGFEAFKDEQSKKRMDTGTSSEEEKKCSFWKQSNQEFLTEKRKNGAYVKKETRTCFRCNEAGHIAWNCPKATNTKQGVSGKLKEVFVDKTESPTEQFKVFKNSTFEIGECSKRFYKRSVKLDNQKWVVKKSEVKSGDESDSTKSEEPQFDESDENSVPSMDDENFPPLRIENFKRKVGKTEVSNQDYSEKDNFDVEKAFNGNVKKIFGKIVDRKVKGVKDFYATKKATYTPTKSELKSPKAGQAWVDIFFA